MASTVVDDALPILEEGRQLLTDFGLRPYRLYVRAGTWDTGEARLGSLTDADTEITPRPLVEQHGSYMKVSNITPSHESGGWTPAQMNPTVVAGVEQTYILQGPDGSLSPYRLRSIDQTSVFRWTLILEPLDRVTPDF